MIFDSSRSLKVRQINASVNSSRRKMFADLSYPIYSYFSRLVVTIYLYIVPL
jgi:hypothetical protein